MPRSATDAFRAAPQSLKILDIDHVNWNPAIAGRVASSGLKKFNSSAVLPDQIPNQLVRLEKEHSQLGIEFGITDDQIFEELQECEVADLLLVPVSYVHDSLVALGYPEERIKTIPYGYDPKAFFPPEPLQERNSDGPLKVLFAGSITVRKGWRHLKEIIERVSRKSDVIFLLAGGIDPSLGHEVKSFVRSKADTVRHLGWLSKPKLGKLMRNSDLAIYPSVFEGFGLTVLQSLACGTPVITTPATAGIDLIEPGSNGYIFEFDDYDQWVEAIIELARNLPRLPAMGELAAESARGLTWADYVDKLDAEIQRII